MGPSDGAERPIGGGRPARPGPARAGPARAGPASRDRTTGTALGPRLVIAGTHSGVGKTTVTTGLLAALSGRGTRVASAKVGPDFVDPGYHALATGRPGANLDPWICGEWAVPALAMQAAAGADILVVEGVMGLFDGATWGWERSGSGVSATGSGTAGASTTGGGERPRGAAPAGGPPRASTASVAKILGAPVLLVVDASSMSHSVAAVVSGFGNHAAGVVVGGVICNRVASDSHRDLLAEALEPLGVPVLGYVRRDDRLRWRDRHLGLVPVVEDHTRIRSALERLSSVIARSCDLDGVERLARSAAPLPIRQQLPATRTSGRVTVAVASGKAFSFVYPENLARLEQAGAELVPFDPLSDERLPERIGGLYAGGGFPEVYAAELSANQPMLASVRAAWSTGLAVWAECGGLLWLSESLDGRPMAGAVPATSSMSPRLTVGYRLATALTHSPLAPPGTVLRGHEFHMSSTSPAGTAFSLESRTATSTGGFAGPRFSASYLHLHLGSDPLPAERFVSAAASANRSPGPSPAATGTNQGPGAGDPGSAAADPVRSHG